MDLKEKKKKAAALQEASVFLTSKGAAFICEQEDS